VAFVAPDLKRDQGGFSLTQPATPLEDGQTTAWIAATGTVSNTRPALRLSLSRPFERGRYARPFGHLVVGLTRRRRR